MDIKFQDPTWPDSTTLLEELIAATEHATSGVGVFSFATPGGVRLLLQDETFNEFLDAYPYQLIVGVDAVTNERALELIEDFRRSHSNFSAHVFFDASPKSRSIFHPKMAWFRSSGGATWLVGSGNLTPGGLRYNVEAFGVTQVSSTDHLRLEKQWSEWLQFHRENLFTPDDQIVIDKSKQNTGIDVPDQRVKSRAQEILVEQPGGKIVVGALQSPGDRVLIAEIPKSGDRWKQANFNKHVFENFFGATPGRIQQRIMLTHIDKSGDAGDVEIRPSVAVKSQNFRFELEAASDLAYPPSGRPIGIFLRVATRTFRYHLSMPRDPHHDALAKFLHENSKMHRTDRMHWIETDVLQLTQIWPECPIFKVAT